MRRLAPLLLLALVVALAPGAAHAATCPDLAQLQAEVLAAARGAFSGQAAHPTPYGGFEVGGFVFGLENLHRRLCLPPESTPVERRELIREHLRACRRLMADLRAEKGGGWSGVRDRLRVQLIDDSLRVRGELVRRPIVEGVVAVVVLDEPVSYLYVPRSALAQWGVSEGALFDQAIENLALHTRGELRVTGAGEGRLLFVGEHDRYDAARLLTPRLRKAAAKLLGDPFRAAIPNREFLVMWARGNADMARRASANARRDFEAQPYPISPLVLEVWVDGRITAVAAPAP